MPTYSDFEATFVSTPEYPRLGALKLFARTVYTHWKERRIKRGGKCIIPQLDVSSPASLLCPLLILYA